MGDFRERALGEDYELVYSDMVISFVIFRCSAYYLSLIHI